MTRAIVIFLGAALLLGGTSRAAAFDESSISFAKDVAPVLVSQCLACHNARTAKGRLSVETYASLMKGGESGAAVSIDDPAFSTLILLLESGEMPKDGDPLPSERIDVIEQWIKQGAKLDEGVPSDEPLTTIIPKPIQPVPPLAYPFPAPVTALDFRTQSTELAVSGYHEVLIFDTANGELLRRIANIAERIYGIAFSPDGRLLAVAAGTPARFGEVTLFQAETGELVADLASAGDSFLDVAFSPDGSALAATGTDRSVRVWTVPEGKEILHIEDHADWVTSVAFSADGSRIATGSRDGTAKVFDLSSKETVATFSGHDGPVSDVLFSPDGSQVISCGSDKQVRWWNVQDAKQKTNRRVAGAGLSLAPLGTDSFVCGTSARKMALFGFDGSEGRVVELEAAWIDAVAASNDGSRIAAGSLDGTVLLIDRESGEINRRIKAMPSVPTEN